MLSAVRGSSMALRLFWLINLVLGVYIAYLTTTPGFWTPIHMFTGIVIVALLWFLGVAQALAKGGSMVLTVITFVIGLAIPIVGMAQLAAQDGSGTLYGLQGLHVVLVLSAIALGEICASRYRKAVALQ